MSEFAFDAFISYSHRDMKWGRWLQRKLETFPLPHDVTQKREGAKKLRVFRDQTDLAGAELQASLNRELERSRYLVVICSPASASSRWVNEEILSFCSLGRRSQIIPLIVAGEPGSDQPALECFPPALRTGEGDEFLGANIQEIGKNKAFLKVVSILLDVRLNRLVDREKQRRLRAALSVGAALAATVAVTGSLMWRNAVISRKNQELSYDIYGASIVSLARKDVMTPEELAFLQASAEAGNVDAMLLLADCYQKGMGTDPNAGAAFSWFQRAAEAGNTQGMIAVANCYLNGAAVAENPQEVFAWNLRAAQAGDASGMVNIASCYEDGFGVQQDSHQAFSWYQRAAENGSALGMYHLARCYRSGIGTETDPTQAFFWMEKLAEAGNPEGMYNLALMYQYAYGTAENPRQAYLWYRKAADAGDASAMRMVGWCIEHQYGISDPALEWYEKAAQAGDQEAAADVYRRLEAPQSAPPPHSHEDESPL